VFYESRSDGACPVVGHFFIGKRQENPSIGTLVPAECQVNAAT